MEIAKRGLGGEIVVFFGGKKKIYPGCDFAHAQCRYAVLKLCTSVALMQTLFQNDCTLKLYDCGNEREEIFSLFRRLD